MKLKRGAKDNNIIAHFISLHDASSATGVDRCNITNCCKGIYKQAGGYKWEYAN